jgi:hypothetical protein
MPQPPALTPEEVFEIWERLSPKEIDLVRWCMKNHDLTLAEALADLIDMGGL